MRSPFPRPHLSSLLSLALVLVGCDSDSAKAVAPPPAPAPTVDGDEAEPKQVAADPAQPESGDKAALALATSEPPGPFALEQVLPNDTHPPLPAADPTRYAKWTQSARIKIAQSHVDTAWLSHDEGLLLVRSGAEATVRVYKTATRKLVGNYKVDGFHKGRFERGNVLPWSGPSGDASFLVVNEAGIKRYGTGDGALVSELDAREHWDGRWTEDGRYLFATVSELQTQSSIIRVFEHLDNDTLVQRGEIASTHRADEIAISHDNRLFAMVTYPAEELVVAELGSGKIRWKQALPQYAGTVDFSPDDTKIAVGGAEVVIFDLQDPSKQARFAGLDNNAHRVRFSPSGDALAVASYDGHARILGTELGSGQLKLLTAFKHYRSSNVYAVTWTRDGSGLWTSSGDKTVRLWSGPESAG